MGNASQSGPGPGAPQGGQPQSVPSGQMPQMPSNMLGPGATPMMHSNGPATVPHGGGIPMDPMQHIGGAPTHMPQEPMQRPNFGSPQPAPPNQMPRNWQQMTGK